MLIKTASLYVFALLVALCSANLLQYADQLPQCGVRLFDKILFDTGKKLAMITNAHLQLSCILQAIPSSACRSVLNSTCICTDADLNAASTSCVLKSCSVEQALKVMKVDDEACNRPRRSRRAALFGFIGVELFTIGCILTRMYSRWKTASERQVDDYLVFVVFVLFLAFTALGQYARIVAFGVDIWTIDSDAISRALMVFYIDESVYLVIISLCKIVMLCFFLRTFPDRWFQRTVQVFVVFVGLAAFALVILQIFQCIPFDYNWEGWKGTMQAKCLDVNSLTYAAASIAIVQDFVIILLPLPLLIKLQLGWRKKTGIILMFSLGALVILTACVRLRYLVVFAKSINPTWDYTNTIIWTALEVNVSIIVISLPAIRVLLSQRWPGMLSTQQSTKTQSVTFGRSTLKSPMSTRQSTKSLHKISALYPTQSVVGAHENESQLELSERRNGTSETAVPVGHGYVGRFSAGSGTHVTRDTITQPIRPRGSIQK